MPDIAPGTQEFTAVKPQNEGPNPPTPIQGGNSNIGAKFISGMQTGNILPSQELLVRPRSQGEPAGKSVNQSVMLGPDGKPTDQFEDTKAPVIQRIMRILGIK